MRILHLIHSEGVYGAEHILLYLAREQLRGGHEPVVGSIRDPGTAETPFEALARSYGLAVERIRIPPRLTPGAVHSLLATMRRCRSEILHSHGYKANILLGLVPRSRRAPMIATLHGWTNPQRFSALWVYEYLDRLALRRIDAVAVVDRHMLSLAAVKAIPTARRHIVQNGIPPLEARQADIAARGLTAIPEHLVEFTRRAPTLVAIGRLSHEKGFALLIEAFAQARKQTRGAHQLLILGEGPQRDILAHLVETLRLTEVVRLGGYVAGADRLLGGAVGFVMSSFTEGMPLVLLEAMQWRVPIVATAVGAIPELLDNGRRGTLVAPNDLAALAGGLRELMSAEDGTAQAVASAFEAVSTHYTSARMAERYLGVYRAIA